MKTKCLKVAFYGKGGIGKSTIAANFSAALSLMGKKVLHIGCDPKGDSTRCIAGGKIKSVLDNLREREFLKREDILVCGFNNIQCVEAGGPEPGIGCAGRGIVAMMDELEDLKIFEESYDVIVFDVLGDVVCGGFGVPMREGYADMAYIVTTSEYMSLYAANNIIKSIEKFSEDNDIALGGIIHNKRNIFSSSKIVSSFAEKTHSNVIYEVEYNDEICFAELEGKTVVEKYTGKDSAADFMEMTKKILNNTNFVKPHSMNNEDLELFGKYILNQLKNEEKHENA